jgi:hypothetical protein
MRQIFLIATCFVVMDGCACNGDGTTGRFIFVPEHCVEDALNRCQQSIDPIAPGATLIITPIPTSGGCGADASFSDAKTTDATVFTATVMGPQILITAVAPGHATLSLLTSSGAVVDSLPLEVAAVATVQIVRPRNVSSVVVQDGTPQTLHYNRIDSTERVLIGTGGANVVASANLSSAPNQAPPPPSFPRFLGSPFTFVGTVGTGTLAVSQGSAMDTLDVAVVATTEIAAIGFPTPPTSVVYESMSLVYIDSAGQLPDGSPVFGPHCIWALPNSLSQFSDAQLMAEEPVFMEDGPYWRDYFTGSGSALCTMGTAAATVGIAQ